MIYANILYQNYQARLSVLASDMGLGMWFPCLTRKATTFFGFHSAILLQRRYFCGGAQRERLSKKRERRSSSTFASTRLTPPRHGRDLEVPG